MAGLHGERTDEGAICERRSPADRLRLGGFRRRPDRAGETAQMGNAPPLLLRRVVDSDLAQRALTAAPGRLWAEAPG